MTDSPVSAEQLSMSDPAYRQAVIDLLGAIAYGELAAFDCLVVDAKRAPDLIDKVLVDRMACQQFAQVDPLLERINDLGADPIAAMAPFVRSFEDFHAVTAPRDWWEGLVKAYVGDRLSADFYGEIAAYLDPDSRAVVLTALADGGTADFVVTRVTAAIEADPKLGGRLALWGRRLMGEALSQAQRVAAERDSLAALLAGGEDRPGLDLAVLSQMFTRLTESHAKRMAALGLAS